MKLLSKFFLMCDCYFPAVELNKRAFRAGRRPTRPGTGRGSFRNFSMRWPNWGTHSEKGDTFVRWVTFKNLFIINLMLIITATSNKQLQRDKNPGMICLVTTAAE